MARGIESFRWCRRRPDRGPLDVYSYMSGDGLEKERATFREALARERMDGDGVYVFVADPSELGHEHHGFIYPLGRNRVFYIGKASAGSGRLITHFDGLAWAAHDFNDKNGRVGFTDPTEWRHEPRYAYAAVYTVWIFWWNLRGRETPNLLETKILMDFYRSFGSVPIANRAWSHLEGA